MNARNKQLVLVAILFSALAGVAYWQFSGVLLGTNGAATAAGGKQGVIPSAGRITTDKMDSADARASAGRNPFIFDKAEITAPPPPPIDIGARTPPPAPPVRLPPTTTTTTNANPQANLPAAVTLNYTGYARDETGRMVAFLETTTPVGHYNLREDDYLLGRIKVSKITVDSVEVEDLERSQKNTIAISPPIAVKR